MIGKLKLMTVPRDPLIGSHWPLSSRPLSFG
jgi:hypothetical protein